VIDDETILSSFEGHTIFSIYFDDIRVYEAILAQLSEVEFEDEENTLGDEIECSFLRRLIVVLKLRTGDLKRRASTKEAEEDLGDNLNGCMAQFRYGI